MSKIVIIGASVAGHTVAVNLREKNKDLNITLITDELYLPYDRRKLTDLLAGNIKEEDISLASEDLYREKNINFIKGKKASGLNANKRTIYFKDKSNIDYDFLVLATGRRFIIPEIPGGKKDGVFAFNGLEDLKDFSQRMINDSVCVVGSHGIALDIARIIAQKYKIETKLISKAAFDPSLVPKEVEVIANPVKEIIGEGTTQAMKLEVGKAVGISAIIFMDEVKSNIEFLKDTNLAIENDLVAVGETMRTNIDTVYACGSVCGVKNWDDAVCKGALVADSIIQALERGRILCQQNS